MYYVVEKKTDITDTQGMIAYNKVKNRPNYLQ